MKKNYLVFVIVLLLVVLLILIFYYLYYTKNGYNASQTTINPNPVKLGNLTNNTYIYTSPVKALSGGDLIRVTIFILDSNAYPVVDKKVELVADDKIDVKKIQEITDNTGRVIFDLSSMDKGKFNVYFKVDSIQDDRFVTITFE